MQNLKNLTDDQLATLFHTACENGDTTTMDAIETEAGRRDRADRRARRNRERWAALRAEWFDWAWAQFLAAETACRGYLLNKDGRAAGIDPWTLWSGRSSRAMRYASEELLEFWAHSPRITVTEYSKHKRHYDLAS